MELNVNFFVNIKIVIFKMFQNGFQMKENAFKQRKSVKIYRLRRAK